MIGHQFDEKTGVYLGDVSLQPNPLQPGGFFMRPGCTLIPLPAIPEGMQARFLPAAERWELIPEGDVPGPVPDVPPVTRQHLAALVAAKRWQVETAGTVWNGIPVLTERDARSVLTSAIVTGTQLDSWPAHWKFADEQFRPVTPDDMRGIALAVKQHVDAAFAAEAAHLRAIAALPDQVAIDGYDVNTGWPS